jgi:hypothetical protein
VIDACRACKHKHYAGFDPAKTKFVFRRVQCKDEQEYNERRRRIKDKDPLIRFEKNQRSRRTVSGRFLHGKTRAQRAGMEWKITKEQHAELLKTFCHYCHGDLNETGSGLDRKDSSIGYTLENVVACCGSCNVIKSNLLEYDEMIEAMNAVTELRRTKALKIALGA